MLLTVNVILRRFQKHAVLWQRRACAFCVAALWGASSLAPAQEKTNPWPDKDVRLATEYLNLLVEKPEYGRVLELLWALYDKHEATSFLLDSVSAQAAGQPHPHVLIVKAHLLRKAEKMPEAITAYEAVLALDEKNTIALRAMADLLREAGRIQNSLSYVEKLTEAATFPSALHSALLVEQGSLLIQLGKPDDAAAVWEKAIREQPDDGALARMVAQHLLGAGFLDKAIVLYRNFAASADPARKLDALFDLSRLEEQAENFEKASEALRQGMDVLHFKDWRYQQFFQKLVKLNERFGQLDTLKTGLLKAAEVKPVSEKALSDLASFFQQIVDDEQEVHWRRELMKAFPQAQEHRWELVGALLDHGGVKEAAQLLDEVLKGDGSDTASLVILRALAHLRLGENKEAEMCLMNLLKMQGINEDVEKQVLAFTRGKSLDGVTEHLLKQRWQRESQKAEFAFDLAAFYRARGRTKEMEKVLSSFSTTTVPEETQRRLNEVSNFLASGNDTQAAENAARLAATQPASGRDELLRLADVLVQRGANEEALRLMESAWTQSDNYEKRTDVDERILSLLTGGQGPKVTPILESPAEFRLPAIFTGEGFGSEAPPPKPDSVSEYVQDYAAGQMISLALKQAWGPVVGPVRILPPWMRPWLNTIHQELVRMAPEISEPRMLRAIWWCLRADQSEVAYELAQRVKFNDAHQWRALPVEAEKLILDLALTEKFKNPLLATRQLHLLSGLDPSNRVNYLLRLAEVEGKRENKRGLPEALQILESLVKEAPGNEAVLSSLAQFYMEDGKREKALELWDKAAREAKDSASPLLERYAELLIALRKLREFAGVQMKLLELESDVKRRREIFQRGMDRMLWLEAIQGGLPDDEKKQRLGILRDLLVERTRRHPFDAFWQEALALVYEREGDTQKAFKAMKQAYYTAPETPFSLDQLRAAALQAGDTASAIYFQKQIAASAASSEQAGEWRQLVQLLESDFRIAEADQARRRLELRFSQDAEALGELASYYAESGQDDSSRRVLEQLARVRGWDGKNLLQLALQQRALGDEKAARGSLIQLLKGSSHEPIPASTPPEKWPWPVLEATKAGVPPISSALTSALENAPGLETAERDRLRVFLSVPREECLELPAKPEAARLRAVAELATLLRNASKSATPQGKDNDETVTEGLQLLRGTELPEIERIWAMFHLGEGPAFRRMLATRLKESKSFEGQFIFLWMGVKSHGFTDVAAWIRDPKLSPARQQQRKGMFQAVCNILAEDPGFLFTREDIEVLGNIRLLSNTELIDVARKLESRQQQELALDLMEAARRNAPSLGADYALLLARLAESGGDQALERHYLKEVWNKPLVAETPNAYDPFMQSFSKLWRTAQTPAERQELLFRSWARLRRLPSSGMGSLREARVMGIAGVTDLSDDIFRNYLGNDFLAAHQFAEPIMGKLPSGLPISPRVDDMDHLRNYWEDLREWTDAIKQDGLADNLVSIESALAQRNGGVPLGPRSNYEFNIWRNNALVRKMRSMNHPQRLQAIREFLESDESVETMLELGGYLESQGLARECIEIYRRLPDRAPSNTEYCEQLLRVCEQARETSLAIPYIEKLFVAEPQFKPQGISEETLREKHAKFLAWQHEIGRLRMLAFRGIASVKPLQGRVPEEVPYLKELAQLLERHGDKAGALAAWEELHRLWPAELDASWRRAALLHEQGNDKESLNALREIPLVNFWNEAVRNGLALRAELAAKGDHWEEIRILMNAVTGGPGVGGTASQMNGTGQDSTGRSGGGTGSGRPTLVTHTGGVVLLSRILSEHGRKIDAQSLLLRAERTVKTDPERFKLRLEKIRLLASDPTWSPTEDQGLEVLALLRVQSDEAEALEGLTDFLSKEAISSRADSWIKLLTGDATVQSATMSLALSAFAARLQESALQKILAPWQQRNIGFRTARELAVRTLLESKKPQWALAVASVGDRKGLTESPVYVEVLAGLGDRHGLQDLFAKVTRLSFPGGGDTAEFAEAFAAAGQANWAEELFALALSRMRDTATANPNLVEAYARYLLDQRRYEQAENLLMSWRDGLTSEMAELLVDLYRGWNKLDRLPRELAKFHLPDSVLTEALFLANPPPAKRE